MGNLGSIKNMLKRIGVASEITSDKEAIRNAKKLILPGVGAFDKAMGNLAKLDLITLIQEKAKEDKIPILGICLGMQLLGNRSEEGVLEGLKLIPGEMKRFEAKPEFKVPHMGWNTVEVKKTSILFEAAAIEPRYYFVHTYYFSCYDEANVIGKTSYGRSFTSVVQKENIFGTQFHPEKSHKHGMRLLKNFVELS